MVFEGWWATFLIHGLQIRVLLIKLTFFWCKRNSRCNFQESRSTQIYLHKTCCFNKIELITQIVWLCKQELHVHPIHLITNTRQRCLALVKGKPSIPQATQKRKFGNCLKCVIYYSLHVLSFKQLSSIKNMLLNVILFALQSHFSRNGLFAHEYTF